MSFEPGIRVRHKANTALGDKIAGHTGTVVSNSASPNYVNVQPDNIDIRFCCPIDGQWHSLPGELEEI